MFGYCIVVSLTAFSVICNKTFYKVYTLFSHTHLTTLSQLLAVGAWQPENIIRRRHTAAVNHQSPVSQVEVSRPTAHVAVQSDGNRRHYTHCWQLTARTDDVHWTLIWSTSHYAASDNDINIFVCMYWSASSQIRRVSYVVVRFVRSCEGLCTVESCLRAPLVLKGLSISRFVSSKSSRQSGHKCCRPMGQKSQ